MDGKEAEVEGHEQQEAEEGTVAGLDAGSDGDSRWDIPNLIISCHVCKQHFISQIGPLTSLSAKWSAAFRRGEQWAAMRAPVKILSRNM